jgi:hypothetical protein
VENLNVSDGTVRLLGLLVWLESEARPSELPMSFAES